MGDVLVTNFYEILQVSRGASVEVIRASYYALSERYRPGGSEPRDEAERMTLGLNEAFATLVDPQKRAAYDRSLADPPNPNPAPPSSSSAGEATSLSGLPPARPLTPRPSIVVAPATASGTATDASSSKPASSAWFWLPLLPAAMIVYAFGLIGAAVAAALYWGGSKLWARAGTAGKVVLSLTAIVITLGVMFAAILLNSQRRPSTAAITQPTATAPSTATQSAEVSPQPVVAPPAGRPPWEEQYGDTAGARSVDPLALDLIWGTATEQQQAAGIDAWFHAHPDHNTHQARGKVLAEVPIVAGRLPAATVRTVMDLALYRAQGAKQAIPANQITTVQAETSAMPANCLSRDDGAMTSRFSGRNVTFNVRSIPIQTFLQLVADESGMHITLDQGIEQQVDVCAFDVPWDYALDRVLSDYGFTSRHTGNALHVTHRESKVAAAKHLACTQTLQQAVGAIPASASIGVAAEMNAKATAEFNACLLR